MSPGLLDLLSRGEPSRASLRDRILLLRSVEALDGLDDDGLTLLAEHAHSRAYRRGDVITQEGESPRTIGIVVEGRVTLTRQGKSRVVATRGQGFGLVGVMAEVDTGRTVADLDSVVLEIPVGAFRMALEENFSLLRNALRLMGAALARARHNLPADPANPPKVELGVYYERPRTLVEQLIALRRGQFVQMNIDALVDIARRMTEVRVSPGHVFWAAGEPSTHALHVEYGRVHCTTADGQSMDIGHDYTLGVMDVWSSQARSYEARADTKVIAYRIDYEDFLVITEMHVSVGLDMVRGIARQYLASEAVETD